MAHCIPTYMLAGGLIEVGMNWRQALITIGLGNMIVLVPILLNAHPGTKYGIPSPSSRARRSGRGRHIPRCWRASSPAGGSGSRRTSAGSRADVHRGVWPGFSNIGGEATIAGLTIPSALTFLSFWALNIYVIYRA